MKNFTKFKTKLFLLSLFFFSTLTAFAQYDCAGAQALVLDMTCANANSSGANSGDPTGNDLVDGNVCSSNYSTGDDYIFSYTGDGNRLQLDLFGTNNWSGLLVTQGCPTTGTCIAQAASSQKNKSLLTPVLTMGTVYYIHISSLAAGSQSIGQFCMNAETVAPPIPPTNDDCGGAISLTVNSDLACNSTTGGTIENATASPEDPSACSGTENDDVWFSFVATSTSHKIAFFNIVNGGTTDIDHSLWEGACGSLTHQGLCSDPFTSTATGLTIGATYYLRVYSNGSGSYTTTFTVCITTPPPPPANDGCSGATVVSSGSTTSQNTGGATNIEDLAPCSGNASPCSIAEGGAGATDFTPGLWYVYNSTGSEEINIDTEGSTFDTEIQVFSGSCGSLTCVGGDDNSGNGLQSTICIKSTASSSAPVDYYIYIDGNGGSSGDMVLNIGTSPLPVTLISFEGEKMEKANKLSWVTGSETNTETHVIERSLDGNRWEEIGKVEASGFSSVEQSYEFLDQDPLGKSYYRLKSVDFDDSFQLSNVVTIERKVKDFSLSKVFPVPVSNELNLEFNSHRNTGVDITIIDIMGRVIHTDVFNAADGTNNFQLDVSDFAAGVYFVMLSDGTEQLTQHIVKN